MRTRITYVHDAEGQFEPEQVSVREESVLIRSLKAARELKITVTLDELPRELRQVLSHSHELHLRWTAEHSFPAIAPFAGRSSPGLLVTYAPSEWKRAVEDRSLCSLLQKGFSDDLRCSNPAASFINAPVITKKFLHFYQLLPSLKNLVEYIRQKICQSDNGACHQYSLMLLSADYADMNYDGRSSSIDLVAYWAQSPEEAGWTETIERGANSKMEVGILASQKPLDPEELRIGGFLAVVGEDKAMKPTLFSFPSRHHLLPESSTYKVSFSMPSGLHPTMKLSIARAGMGVPEASSTGACRLHAFVTLPSSIFADKYQLSTTDTLFLQSHNLGSLRSIAGETDLEIPDWATSRWGSHLLLELATPTSQHHPPGSSKADDDWDITIPLHLRYLHPSASGHRNISIPWPIVFWACATEHGTKFDWNPFDRLNMAWDALFTQRTAFFQFHPSSSSSEQPKLVEQLQVPVLRIPDDLMKGGDQAARNIELGTILIITAGFLWIVGKLGLVVKGNGLGRRQAMPNQSRKLKG